MLPDVKSREFVTEVGDDPEEQRLALQAARGWLLSSVQRLMGSRGPLPGKTQQYRNASYWWLLALNNALFGVLGVGLEKFVFFFQPPNSIQTNLYGRPKQDEKSDRVLCGAIYKVVLNRLTNHVCCGC